MSRGHKEGMAERGQLLCTERHPYLNVIGALPIPKAPWGGHFLTLFKRPALHGKGAQHMPSPCSALQGPLTEMSCHPHGAPCQAGGNGLAQHLGGGHHTVSLLTTRFSFPWRATGLYPTVSGRAWGCVPWKGRFTCLSL